jgi:hypothetical protein
MEILAQEYGWTLTEIRSLSTIDVMALWRIVIKRRDLEKAQSKKAGR